MVVDSQKSTAALLHKLFPEDEIVLVARADQAVEQANLRTPDCVVLELGLARHSGLEFLYEFRTYPDWQAIPCIVLTNVELEPDVLRSRSWQQLNVAAYAYKSDTSHKTLQQLIEQQRAPL